MEIRSNPLKSFIILSWSSSSRIILITWPNTAWSSTILKAVPSLSKVRWGRAVIVNSEEFLFSSDTSNQKVLNSLRVIDLASFLLKLLEINFFGVFIKLISKGYSLEALEFMTTKVISAIILLHLFFFTTK